MTAADRDYSIFSAASFLSALGTVTTLITVLLAAVASISLLVGGIGVMNIKLVTVTERTREIGLRKAIGAPQGVIIAQFMFEAVLLSMMGGLAGVVVGLLGSQISISSVTPAVAPWSVFGFSVAIGLIFGIYPARRAARLKPIDAPDLSRTAVRPGLADDLLEPPPHDEDDLLEDEAFMAPGGRRPSRLTRVLLALLICGVGILIGVQLGLAPGAAGAGRSGAGSPTPSGPASPVPAAQGEVSSIGAHTLVVDGAGTSRTVTFTDDTTVTKPYGRGALGVGDAVTVTGSRAADGSVNATSIVVR